MVLAYVTDEGYSLLVDDEGASISKSVSIAANKKDGDRENLSGSSAFLTDATNVIIDSLSAMIVAIRSYLPEVIGSLIDRMVLKLQKKWKQYQLHLETLKLKKQAKTKRQFFYLVEKMILNLPIQKDETEIDSYLDCKNHLRKLQIWPFMWEVNNVRNDKIGCSGYECIPMSSYR